MNELDDVINKGHITIYLDTDKELVDAINKHNEHLIACRHRKRYLAEMEFAYLVSNPLLILVLVLEVLEASTDAFFGNPVLGITILVLQIAAFIFSFFKRNLVAGTVCCAALLFFDLRFLILLSLNIILCIWHLLSKRSLKAEKGYPAFSAIRIRYERFNCPENSEI